MWFLLLHLALASNVRVKSIWTHSALPWYSPSLLPSSPVPPTPPLPPVQAKFIEKNKDIKKDRIIADLRVYILQVALQKSVFWMLSSLTIKACIQCYQGKWTLICIMYKHTSFVINDETKAVKICYPLPPNIYCKLQIQSSSVVINC